MLSSGWEDRCHDDNISQIHCISLYHVTCIYIIYIARRHNNSIRGTSRLSVNSVLIVCVHVHRVSTKLCKIVFCQNFIKFSPILIIFGRKMAKRLKLCEVLAFSTSSNSRHHTTMLNADVPNCYTTL